ncbi:MAG: membrane protein insertase YidC [Flavobacteriales bacterium]|nr:membrane protein insertase YidC [Flavobacteriales bacterium]
MDRNSIIGYVLIFLIFVGWILFDSYQKAEELEAQKIEQSKQDSIAHAQFVADSIAGKLTAHTEAKDTNIATPDSLIPPVMAVPEKTFVLKNNDLSIELSSKGGTVSKVQLLNYKRSDSSDLVLLEKGKNRMNYSIPMKSGVVQTNELDFELKSMDEKSMVLIHRFAGGGAIEQEYKLGDNFLVDYSFRLVDLQNSIHKNVTGIDMNWESDLVLQEKIIDDERNVATVCYKYKDDKGYDDLSASKDDEDQLQKGVWWLSFKQKFFMSTLIFPNGLERSGAKISVREPETNEIVKSMSALVALQYGFAQSDEHKMQFYFGPNHYQTLKKLDVGLERTIDLGPKIFRWVNKWAVIPIFNWLSKYIKSYGLIILLLTLIIKLVLVVPMYKSYVSSAKMRILKPELDEIKEKTGGDLAKAQQEQMKLYKRAGASPLGGCLPQLVQLPILIALFRFFPSSIELRQKSFLWAKDLSTFDDPIRWSGDFWPIGDHISLFCLLMAASSFLSIIYNAQSTAGVNNQMKYIMYFMPVMLFFWFNNYSAGLSYYYLLANLITFGQNIIFQKFIVDEDKIRAQIEENKRKKVTVKTSRFQKRMEEYAKKRGIDPKNLRR